VNRTILVTGAAGFIGSHTAMALLRRGDRVVGLDNFDDYYDPARKRSNIEAVRAAGGEFELVTGDIRDRALVERIFRAHPFHAVVHLAAMAGVRASVDNPWLYYDINLTGTLNLLEASRQHGRPNFVFASTSSAYGRTERVPFDERDNADRPLAPYPASKRAAELLGHSYHHIHGTDFTALRFFTVYGPHGRPDMMAYLVLESMRLGKPIPLYNGGQMYRDWTYVGDIVDGVVAAADRRLGYEIINLGRGEPVRLLDFIEALGEHSGKRPNLVDAPMMAADVSYTFASVDKARRLLDYAPRVSVNEGARRFYEWYAETIGPF
jgi:UDP-glucuronate 4-epimerase